MQSEPRQKILLRQKKKKRTGGMALYDASAGGAVVSYDRALAERNRFRNVEPMFKTKEDIENFEKSAFMQRCREHAVVLHDWQVSGADVAHCFVPWVALCL